MKRRRRRRIKTGPVDAVNAGGDGEKRSAKHRDATARLKKWT